MGHWCWEIFACLLTRQEIPVLKAPQDNCWVLLEGSVLWFFCCTGILPCGAFPVTFLTLKFKKKHLFVGSKFQQNHWPCFIIIEQSASKSQEPEIPRLTPEFLVSVRLVGIHGKPTSCTLHRVGSCKNPATRAYNGPTVVTVVMQKLANKLESYPF